MSEPLRVDLTVTSEYRRELRILRGNELLFVATGANPMALALLGHGYLSSSQLPPVQAAHSEPSR